LNLDHIVRTKGIHTQAALVMPAQRPKFVRAGITRISSIALDPRGQFELFGRGYDFHH